MPRTIDLNADLGEGITDDPGLLAVVTSANVACGFHAGDAETMRSVCRIAAERGVAIGAQVSYWDRENFGRQSMDVPARELTVWVREQISMLSEVSHEVGIGVSYLKPHGALYNRVIGDAEQARAVLAGSAGLPILTLPIGELRAAALADGRLVRTEGFPDRGYTDDGQLIPRDQAGALVEEVSQIAMNAVALADRRIDSVCVHGDSPGAVAAAIQVRAALENADFALRSPWR